MDEHTRNQINSFLNSSSTKLISNLIKSLEDKTLDLSSSTIAIKKRLPGTEVLPIKKIFSKFKTSEELILALTLLDEIKNFNKINSQSTKLVCTSQNSSIDCSKTDIVLKDLFKKAEKSITIIGYLMTDDKHILEIFDMIKKNSNIKKLIIKFIFDTAKQKQQLGKKYPSITKIIQTNWDKEIPYPKVYSYKEDSSSLHAKAVIIDSKEIFITSANMSGRALQRNFELGICHTGESAQIAENLIEELIDQNWFERVSF
tara:strand:+ start:979 stop:1752 length:774 start_codon:yes stop_codon:yes gene_type:complete